MGQHDYKDDGTAQILGFTGTIEKENRLAKAYVFNLKHPLRQESREDDDVAHRLNESKTTLLENPSCIQVNVNSFN